MPAIVRQFLPYILSAIIAVVSFFTGLSDVGQSVQIALDKDKAIVQATEILQQSTPTEVKEAIAKESE